MILSVQRGSETTLVSMLLPSFIQTGYNAFKTLAAQFDIFPAPVLNFSSIIVFDANHLSRKEMASILLGLRNEIAHLESDKCSWIPAPLFAAALQVAERTLYEALLCSDAGFRVGPLPSPLRSTSNKLPRSTNPQSDSHGCTPFFHGHHSPIPSLSLPSTRHPQPSAPRLLRMATKFPPLSLNASLFRLRNDIFFVMSSITEYQHCPSLTPLTFQSIFSTSIPILLYIPRPLQAGADDLY